MRYQVQSVELEGVDKLSMLHYNVGVVIGKRISKRKGALYLTQEVIMADTGEYRRGVLVISEVKDKDFAKVFIAFSKKVLEDIGILKGEAKLLMWFLAKTVELPIQSEMWILLDYQKLAQELNVSTTSLKLYIAKLKKLGYIEQFKTKQTIFRIKPEFVYKGVLAEYKGR